MWEIYRTFDFIPHHLICVCSRILHLYTDYYVCVCVCECVCVCVCARIHKQLSDLEFKTHIGAIKRRCGIKQSEENEYVALNHFVIVSLKLPHSPLAGAPMKSELGTGRAACVYPTLFPGRWNYQRKALLSNGNPS